MSAPAALRGRRFLGQVAARAVAWLVEPVEDTSRAEPIEIRPRPVTAVVGLASRCGTTTVARALGVELGARDPAGAAVVAGGGSGPLPFAIPFSSSAAAALAGTLRELGAADARPVGRLGLVAAEDAAGLAPSLRHRAPLVLDVGHGTPPGVPASLADHTVLVGSPRIESALAAAVAESLARVGPEPVVVVNRAYEAAGWDPAPQLLPEARAGAQVALAGRRLAGPLATAVADLADLCDSPQAEW